MTTPAAAETTVRGTLAGRLARTACVDGRFTLPDGQVLDSYFDEYRLAADPQLLHDVADAMAAMIPDRAEVLAGVELGGVPLVVALSAASGLPAAFLRRLPKSYGSQQQIEGTPVDGRRVVLVDRQLQDDLSHNARRRPPPAGRSPHVTPTHRHGPMVMPAQRTRKSCAGGGDFTHSDQHPDVANRSTVSLGSNRLPPGSRAQMRAISRFSNGTPSIMRRIGALHPGA